MRRRCVLLLESNTSGTGRLFAQAIVAAQYIPILISSCPSRYAYVAEDHLRTVEANTSSLDELLIVCRELERDFEIAGVMSSSEYSVATAARLAQKLGLPSADAQAIEHCRDKAEQRRQLRHARVAAPECRCVTSVAEATSASRLIGLPVILKPIFGSGSIGVQCCVTESEVSSHAARLLKQRVNERGTPVPARILVEAYVPGIEYSVETFGLNILGITRKHPGQSPRFVAIGHEFPGALDPANTTAMTRMTLDALRALGLQWGPAHTEFTVTTEGPVLIEINPRLAGSYIPELVRLAQGVDLITAFMELSTGRRPNLAPTRQQFASVRFLMAHTAGRCLKIAGIAAAAGIPGIVDVRPYRPMNSDITLHGDFRDKLAHVIAVADTLFAARTATCSALTCLNPEMIEPTGDSPSIADNRASFPSDHDSPSLGSEGAVASH